ncbi:endoribonuclease Dicer homolog 2 [Impatiens glandulifera]|uniref:endoribonuclease Dicer homolog 2 n=1 Tax=Impatiens glandulifera TaxID=253017 RepID=UPI001FB11F72|nr:endoribonuclease Dicer homolog 2 [Impatiens glandulifera]
MNSKVHTVVSESVLAEYIPFSNTKMKFFKDAEIPISLSSSVTSQLNSLEDKYKSAIEKSDLSKTTSESTKKKMSKLFSTYIYCFEELGLWLALKAAESISREESEQFSCTKSDVCGEKFMRDLSLEACKLFSSHLPSGQSWSISDDINANVDAGYLTYKVICLLESLLEYRDKKEFRCIIFVDRVVTAIVLPLLLNDVLPKLCSWNTKYTAGHQSRLQSQSRTEQHKVVEDFRSGAINIIVATSILEEGLDVQSCNVVIRFDLSSTVCSFIQSRGRARVQGSDFVLMMRNGDKSSHTRMENYLKSGEVMREESILHASVPCGPLKSQDEPVMYRVESTGAIVTLTSSVVLLYFYCSRLPSDGYFKPAPYFQFDDDLGTCTLYLPKSSSLTNHVTVSGNGKFLKKMACLEACKQLHQIGALTDHLVPDMVVEQEAAIQVLGSVPNMDNLPNYFPPELIDTSEDGEIKSYHCYFVKMSRDFEYYVPLSHVMLVFPTKFELSDEDLNFELNDNRGFVTAQMKYEGPLDLNSYQVAMARRFQVTLFTILLDHSLQNLEEALSKRDSVSGLDYLVLPCKREGVIDWNCVISAMSPRKNLCKEPLHSTACEAGQHRVHTKHGLVCHCMLVNSVAWTPHNGHVYLINDTLTDKTVNSLMDFKSGVGLTYNEYYKSRYSIDLHFDEGPLLKGRRPFVVHNNPQTSSKRPNEKERISNPHVQLPPELCLIIMSPISASTFYSFSFVPVLMHRLESLLVAVNLKGILKDHCIRSVDIPTLKVLEAITTKRCQEKFHLESLETLGDSFLKYATSQQLFKTFQNQHEGLLTIKRSVIISNATLCRLGCEHKLPGFIRDEPFNSKVWIIPGDHSGKYVLDEESISSTKKVYNRGMRKMKFKRIADVVEALIGAFLSTGGEEAALLFLNWLGIEADRIPTPYIRLLPIHPERLVNVGYFQDLLHYSFRDISLLVEAVTHGSYMLPEVPLCYQRLEFVGDAVLDYIITLYLYNKYPGLTPGLLTDLRSASVNNDCYARSAIKANLHKHVLHASQDLHKHVLIAVQEVNMSETTTDIGWESETNFPKVLGDVMESIAGAIFIDSGYNLNVVFESMRGLLEPIVTPESLKVHPVRELTEFCQKEHYGMEKPVVSREKGMFLVTVEVEANGTIHKYTGKATDKKIAKKQACSELLSLLKDSMSTDI